MFIGKPLAKSFFFTKKGDPIIYKRFIHNKYSKRIIKTLKDLNYNTQNFNPIHQAIPLRKSYFKIAWKLFKKELNETQKNKFRKNSDIWIMGLISHICQYNNFKNKCKYLNISNKDNFYICMKSLHNYSNIEQINKYNKILNLRKRQGLPALICINNIDIHNKFHTNYFKRLVNLFKL